MATVAPALPAAAIAEEYYVPPSNSAATQYTEAFPTSGGSRNLEREGEERERSPAGVLGAGNARKLERRGPAGRAAAEAAAATAPAALGTGAREGDDEGEGAAGSSRGGGGDGDRAGGAPSSGDRPSAEAAGDGSSGIAAVLGQATGVSGATGALLPLVILGAIAWALAYAWRQRRRPAA